MHDMKQGFHMTPDEFRAAGRNVIDWVARYFEQVETLPVPPRQLRPEIDPALEEVVLHALESNPEDRFETAFETREALVHPSSVVTRARATRTVPPPGLPWWLRPLLIGLGVLAVCGAIMCAASRRH